MKIFFSAPKRWLVLLAFTSILFCGCGSSATDDIALDLTPDEGRVAHQSWGSYNLYRYEGGSWIPVIDLGAEVQGVPTLGERPVLLVHGLGSRIDTGKFSDLAANLVSNGATSAFGFEYDSLDPIGTNAGYFTNALQFLTRIEKDRVWRVVGHSMGALVARSSFEQGATLDVADIGNIASFAAGPHLGSDVARALQDAGSDTVDQALQDSILDGKLDFRNADDTPVKVTGDEPSFAQLVPNSTFLTALNANVSHPQWSYRTLAGNERSNEFRVLNEILGVTADDGIVDVDSANAPVVNQVRTDVVPYDHVTIVEAQPSILVILDQLALLTQ